MNRYLGIGKCFSGKWWSHCPWGCLRKSWMWCLGTWFREVILVVEAWLDQMILELLVRSNNLSDKITILTGKIEEISLPESVDVVISEPMGYLLFNERMLESYLHSKKWLKSNGECATTEPLRMFPVCCTVFPEDIW
uniref:Methyltransferase domain-containing protein n=1 Tax=Anas platyrhynchos platyrhynchos TaxID=8840 RepID=A0A493TBK4_ANAPP